MNKRQMRDWQRPIEGLEFSCPACGGTGHGVDDYPRGSGYAGCPDCQGTGKVLPPNDFSGETRTLEDMEEEDEIKAG